MKKLGLILGVVAMSMIVGCSTTKSGSAGAVGSCSKGSECCKAKADGSMGTVSDKKTGCSSEKSGCSAEKAAGCSEAKAQGSMGAVSEKSGCSSQKTGCSAAKTECSSKQQ
jgi:hypothetical protein